MPDRPSPNRLLILWSLQDDYARTLAPDLRSHWLSVKLVEELPPPELPAEPAARPTADDVPLMQSTQAAYEVFQGIDQLMGDADEFTEKAKASRGPDRSASEALPLRVEYRVTLRRAVTDPGVAVAFAAGFIDTVDRAAQLPRFLVLGTEQRAGSTDDRPGASGGPGAVFRVATLEYCTLVESLRKVATDFGDAADLPLPDGWFAGTPWAAFLAARVLPHPVVAAALGGAGR